MIAEAEAIDSLRRIVLDMDSTELPVYGRQEHSAYIGHFESTCYNPPLLLNREGDCLAVNRLTPNDVHSAEDWEQLRLQVDEPIAAIESPIGAAAEDQQQAVRSHQIMHRPNPAGLIGERENGDLRGDFRSSEKAVVLRLDELESVAGLNVGAACRQFALETAKDFGLARCFHNSAVTDVSACATDACRRRFSKYQPRL